MKARILSTAASIDFLRIARVAAAVGRCANMLLRGSDVDYDVNRFCFVRITISYRRRKKTVISWINEQNAQARR